MNILRHSEQLGNFGISLHNRIVESLVNQIEYAIEFGKIRCSVPTDTRRQLFSVYDFIREILKINSERKAWKRWTESDPNIVAFCHYVPFSQKSGYIGKPSPAADITGLIYLAYMASGEFSQRLRASSAAYFAADHSAATTPARATSQAAAAKLPEHIPVAFKRTLTELHQVSGIKSRCYVAAAVKRDFELGIDYLEDGEELLITEDVFYWLIASFRSQRGTDTANLPQNIRLTRQGFRLRLNRKNARLSSAATSQTVETTSQTPRSHNVSPVSLANLLPQPCKFGEGVETKPIRIPVFLKAEIEQYIADRLTQTD